ncbi:hypothetical protein [Salegentibacter sp. Hel_I_6]|uniref:hypothetical protein n=1 Tax=Salegentibacter sp. Hel_I_6 TaxID=1250278 RepID=UPI00055BF0DC|nr:hypothetical protein [Salegentibacter sp. Hel_I_6]
MNLPVLSRISLLKLCSVCVFFGRAYEHIFFDAPFRSILWDEALLSPVVEVIFKTNWNDYVTDITLDNAIQTFIQALGIFYLVCGLICTLINKKNFRIYQYFLVLGTGALILLAFLDAKSNFYHFSMFLEHAIQFGSPLALLLYFKTGYWKSWQIFTLKLIIAGTFLSHGLYAIGWPYPLPGNFVTMTMNILSISEDSAKSFLLIAGCLDLLVAVLIFIPVTLKIALIYAAIWGFVTALSRIISGFTYELSPLIIHQYMYATIYRIPHGLFPLFTLLIIDQMPSNNSKNTANEIKSTTIYPLIRYCGFSGTKLSS